MVKISETSAVNPKHVLAILFNKENLKTIVVMLGNTTIPSDHTFADTVNMLTVPNVG